jgi:ABC-type Zn uptake system ZnuABC Zn-binding protein ZnuA
MINRYRFFILLAGGLLLVGWLAAACQPPAVPAPLDSGGNQATGMRVLAVETYLADIAQNVAGERVKVEALIPVGLDPHAFEPVPQDVARIAESNVLIVNGAGFESWLDKTLANAGGQRMVIEASAGLAGRTAREGEQVEMADDHHEGDPHFWLDPLKTVRYVENIRDGLIQADLAGREEYTRNAAAYIARLNELDRWIQQQVAQIPPEKRLIVTNHESFGYFADRYGFKIIGTILPSVSTGASPSAQQLARLVDQIKATGATAIFLETGTDPRLAEQVAQETGVKVVTELYSHSITPPGGKAPTYLEMMRYNVETIIAALR